MTKLEMINFVALGLPSPGGSKNAFFHKKTGRIVVVDAGGKKTKKWRDVVSIAAKAAMDGNAFLEPPISLIIEFRMPRPQHHFKPNGDIKSNVPWVPIVRPDITKLLRSTEDAMTGIVWKDDSHICEQIITRMYTLDADSGARVTVFSTQWKSNSISNTMKMSEFYEEKPGLKEISEMDEENLRNK